MKLSKLVRFSPLVLTVGILLAPRARATTAYYDYITNLNPFAYYRLDEASGTATNVGTLGSAADGTYAGAVTNQVAGPQETNYPGFETNNQAITVNAGWVDINNPAGLNISGQITLQAWIKIPAASALNTSGHIGNIIAHGYSSSDYMETVLRVRNNGGTRVYNIGTYNSVNWSDAGTSFNIPAEDIGGDWVYLVGTYDGAVFNLYRNGVWLGSAADPQNQGAWATSFGEWGIGANVSDTGPGRFFDGTLDEVAVFNYALTADQVWAAYTNATGITGTLPIITVQPVGDPNLYVGESYTLTVTASGIPSPTYQWRTNGVNIPGATSSSYVINPAAVADSGNYDVVVANVIGSVTSSVAVVTVYDPATLTNSTAYKDFILSLSPLAYYRLDEDASGLVAANLGTLGTAVDGTYSGSVTSLVRSFRPPSYPGLETNNKAVTFSANGYVSIPNDTSLNITGAVTLVAWVKLPSTTTWSGIGNIVAHGYGSEVNETVLRLNGTAYEVGNYRGTCCWSGVNAGSTIPAGDFGGDWVFLVGTFDGTQWNLYRNGSLVSTAADSYGAVQTDGLWGIGARAAGPDRYVGAGVNVDEAAIYNFALTSAQVMEAYNKAKGIVCTAPAISSQPVGNTNLYIGESHTLSVSGSGTAPLSYQWRQGGSNLSGATNSSYPISPAAVADSGNYDVVVANGCGSVTSSVATVTVYDPSTLNSSTAYKDYILGFGPLAYYRLDEASGTATNLGSLGSAADGTYIGTVTYQVLGLRPPAVGGFETNNKAVTFSSTGAVSMGNPAGLNISNLITLAAWVKLPGTATWSGDANIVVHGYSTVDYRETTLRFSGNTYQVGNYSGDCWCGANASYTIPAGDYGGDWVSLVGTFDGAQWKLYRNGVLVATANDTYGAWPTDNGVWGIGANTTLNNRYIGAVTVDEVAIFDYPLSPSQVHAQYNLARFGSAALTVNIGLSGTDVTIIWLGNATLQEASSVTGPYVDVTGATSPHTVSPSGAAKFFRLKQ